MLSKRLSFCLILTVKSKHCQNLECKVNDFEEEANQKCNKGKQSLTESFPYSLNLFLFDELIDRVIKYLLNAISQTAEQLNGDEHIIRTRIFIDLIPGLFGVIPN